MNILSKPGGKKRLILDGSLDSPLPLNLKISGDFFKMEQLWLQGREIFAGCTHGGILDLSNAFYHIDIAEDRK